MWAKDSGAFVLSCAVLSLSCLPLSEETKRLDWRKRRAVLLGSIPPARLTVALREILVRSRVRVRGRASVAEPRDAPMVGELISSKMVRSKNGDASQSIFRWRLTDNTSGPVPAAFLTLARCLRRPLFLASIAGPSTCAAGTRYRHGYQQPVPCFAVIP